MNFENILSNFNVIGKYVSCEKFGEGHINDTYLVVNELNEKSVKYILQKINNKLFKDIEKLMSNIEKVTDFNQRVIINRGGNPKKECLTLIKTINGKSYLSLKEGYFRLYNFIEDANCYQTVEKPEHFYESAVAFGNFQNMLAKFDASQLYEILPNFHNTKVRFNDFLIALKEDKMSRADSVKNEIAFVLEREKYCCKIIDLLQSGKMPLRVTHNDTKLNNVMIDAVTEKGVAVIDLDTIMPGSVCYDFGDSIRFGCNPVAEDEVNLNKVNFKIDLFKTYAEGFLSVLNLTDIELENLAFSSILMTYECGIRFLTDYLQGDTYFKISRKKQNLDRARTQFKLVFDMEKQLDTMNEIITGIKLQS
jgi:Ser/Thr protein kinase RdoA (MazF antagonist)